MRAVRYHPDASAEFLREIEYYLALSPALSERFDRAVLACEVRAAESPDRWPKYLYNTRRILDRKFKFSLVYSTFEGEIAVLAVAAFRRRPGYWKSRLNDG